MVDFAVSTPVGGPEVGNIFCLGDWQDSGANRVLPVLPELPELEGRHRAQEVGWEINFWAGPPPEGSMS